MLNQPEASQSPETAPIPSDKVYSAILCLNNKEYAAEGENLEEALLSFHPEFFKTKGILTIKKGDKKVVKVLNIRQMKRLWGGGGTKTQEIILGFITSNLKFLLGEARN